jgi:hypothetical protein
MMSDEKTGIVESTYRKLKELREIPGRLALERAVRNHSQKLPSLDPEQIDLLSLLNSDGGTVTSLNKLGIPRTEEMLVSARKMAETLKGDKKEGFKSYIMEPSAEKIFAEPDLLLWGLEEKLLNLVENYLEVPPFYRGVTVRRDLADGTSEETRLFHTDSDDRKMLKLIVYLNDVDENGGGFEFISKKYNPNPSELQFFQGRVLDDEMAKHVSREKWKRCIGPKESTVFVDTHAVYHRGSIPNRDRYTIFFCYNTRKPRWPESCLPLFSKDEAIKHYGSRLSERQRSCISTTGSSLASGSYQ